ncbi:MAG: YbaK/EbsC family protein [Hyphomonadaceae bacterium]|jgi:prolyl-tRNA editing enzyme YbaK/EbsC (Cys-tRNA(Pro) deacylase)|nr:YbaK/EbsC family protein [Hyphomonadaceae bacterium]
MSQLKPAAQRVQEVLRTKGLETQVRHMPASTRTAQEAAQACGCQVGQIVKSLVFRGAQSGKPYLLLVSGANRVDETLAGAQVGEALGRADAQFVRDATGFAIGGIPPLGHASPIATFMDEALLAYDQVWAAAGTPDAVFPIAPGRLAEAIEARPIRVVSAP